MTAPTSMELSVLTQFQDKLADLQLHNVENGKDMQMFLVRFLRARNYNLSKAEDMLRKHLEWKKVNKIDSLLDWTPPRFIAESCNCLYDVAGFDKQGCPILVVPFGIWDVRKVCENGLRKDYVKYVDQLFLHVTRAMEESSRRKGTTITQFVCIMLSDEFHALRQMASPTAVDSVLETVRRFECNYPEMLKCAFVLDFPTAFTILFNLVKPLLNSTTLGKITMTSNEKDYKTALSNLIDEDQLCIRLGGTRRSNVPLLNAERGAFKPVQSNEDPHGFREVMIGAGQTFKLEHEIDCEDSQIRWAFKTDNHDIGFSLIANDLKEELVSYSRVTSHVDPHEGEIICPKPGKYTMIFDNSFSRFRSKMLRYKVFVDDQPDYENISNSCSSLSNRKKIPVVGDNDKENGNGSSSGNDSEVESTSL